MDFKKEAMDIMTALTSLVRSTKVDADINYIMPAIQLNPYMGGVNWTSNKRYSERAIHIGIDKNNGKVATLCGAHHNRNNNHDWDTLDMEDSDVITCCSCIRSLKKLVRENPDIPKYQVIMDAVGEKIQNAEFHIKQKGSNTQSNNTESEIEPIARDLGGAPLGCPIPQEIDLTTPEPTYSRYMPNGVILHACKDYYSSMWRADVHAATTNEQGNIVSICGHGNNLGLISHEELEDHPNITCPACVEITRKRFPEHGPKRDKTAKQRATMIEDMGKYVGQLYNAWKEAKAEYDRLKRSTLFITK